MNAPLFHRPHGLTRRGFLAGAGAGLAAGVPLTYLGLKGLEALDRQSPPLRSFTGRSVEVPHPPYAMPGPYPGRVIEVHHGDAVRPSHRINADAVKRMMDCGMCELTGADDALEAWRRFFLPGDVVGIKVNPVGYRR